MDFVIENYLWFGMAGFLLLMALIGFLAEKTDFIDSETRNSEGANVKKAKKDKKKKNKKVSDNTDYEQIPSNDQNLSSEVLDYNNLTVNETQSVVNDTPLSMDDSLMQPVMDQQVPVMNEQETMMKQQEQIVDQQEPVINQEESSVVTSTGEDLAQPFGDQQVTPVINTPTETVSKVVTSDEDIWKF